MERKLLILVLLSSLFVTSSAWANALFCQGVPYLLTGSPSSGATGHDIDVGSAAPASAVCHLNSPTGPIVTPSTYCGGSFNRAYIDVVDTELFEVALSAMLKNESRWILIFDGQTTKGCFPPGWPCKVIQIYK